VKIDKEFVAHSCDLLAGLGAVTVKRMFGGFGLSLEGMNIAILADLGAGPCLWLKADDSTRTRFESAGCQRFTYMAKGLPRSVNYYSAPDDAMESPALMQPWALLALECALRARKPKITGKHPR
jgi:DNA transformation protein